MSRYLSHRPMAAILVAATLLLVTTASRAGDSGSWEGTFCYAATDGSGTCAGILRDFRNSSDQYMGVAFWQESNGTKQFVARWQSANNWHTCYPNAQAATAWPAAMSATNAYVSVSWDATGTCNDVYVANASWAR
jgi:hypothetical protein